MFKHLARVIWMDIISGECPKAEVKRQCFDVDDDKLVLKKTHLLFSSSVTVINN